MQRRQPAPLMPGCRWWPMPERRSRWQRTQDRAGGATRQRDRASARKQQLLDKLKASIKAPTNSVHLEEAPPARLVRDCEGYSRALDEISFFALGDADPSTISSEYRSIVENAVRVADSGDCLALLVWPPETFSPSAVAGLMTLAATASAKRSEISVAGAKSWARMEADPVRVAIFPYARSTHARLRRSRCAEALLGTRKPCDRCPSNSLQRSGSSKGP